MTLEYKDYPESCVYWIHLKGIHTDPFTEGYVGVSIHGAEKRFKNHCWHAERGSKYPVHRAIRKYGDLITASVLLKGTPEYCLEVERRFRPVGDMPNVWNIGAGGQAPQTGRKLSEESKKKVSAANKGRIPSTATRQKMREAQLGRKHPEEVKAKIGAGNRTPHTDEARKKMSESWNRGVDWAHPRANKAVWILAAQMFQYLVENPEHGCERMMAFHGLPKSSSSAIHKKLKSGWNPLNDEKYLAWLDQYNKTRSENESTLAA